MSALNSNSEVTNKGKDLAMDRYGNVDGKNGPGGQELSVENLSEIIHDLNNALMTVQCGASLMTELGDDLDGEMREYLTQIIQSTKRAAQRVEQIRQIGRSLKTTQQSE